MGRTSQIADHEAEIRRRQPAEQAKNIAASLGLPYQAMIAYCKRRGIRFPKTRPKKANEAEIERLLGLGQTQQQVAEALGLHPSTIERRAGRLGLQTARTGPRSGQGHPDWAGGRMLDKHGYVLVWAPMHPAARKTGYVLEHRLVLEAHLGRFLPAGSVVHHTDEHPHHNWPANLESFASNADHLRHELTGRAKPTPRKSIPGAYGSSQTIDRCPAEHETLARCPSETRLKLAWMLESLRPTTEHRSAPRQAFHRSGGWRDPFGSLSMA